MATAWLILNVLRLTQLMLVYFFEHRFHLISGECIHLWTWHLCYWILCCLSCCQDSLAEWSKAPDSSSGGAIRVGSNPTAVTLLLHILTLNWAEILSLLVCIVFAWTFQSGNPHSLANPQLPTYVQKLHLFPPVASGKTQSCCLACFGRFVMFGRWPSLPKTGVG